MAHAQATAGSAPNYLTDHKGWLSWAFTLDHKRIGIMYLASVSFFFLIGGLLALAMRLELATGRSDFLAWILNAFSAKAVALDDPTLTSRAGDLYNKLFTLHGAIMVFLFIIPSIPATLGNFVLPLMLGAKDVAFPRLNLASYHIYVVGALLFIVAILTTGLDTGWTFYTPYSTTTSTAVVTATFAVFILGFSSIFTGLNFVVTIHKMRAPGLTWGRLPLFVWAIYATSLIQILATPVLAITMVLLFVERFLDIGIFDPNKGGDPVLYQHFFWFYSHPAVYIMILPGFGVISELITVHSRKRIFGYNAIAGSSVAIALIGFLVWGHHMFTSGQSEVVTAVFSFLTFAVAVPTAIKVFSWVATLWRGSIALNTPMLYALAFIFTFTIGGLTGIFLGALSVDIHLHDTYFVVAHFHYVMMGGTFIAFLGGIHHWWPKMFGRMYNETAAFIAWLLVFIGFNTTFLAQFVVGAHGMPRRYHEYLPQFEFWHQISTVGSLVLAVGLFIALGYLIASLVSGRVTAEDPWTGVSLEWETTTPPDTHNFHHQPVVTRGPYDFPEIDDTIVTSH